LVLIGTILLIALQIYNFVMWARLILDWVVVLVPQFRPRGLVLVLAEVVYTVTDPPLKLVRRWLKPVRVGPIALDLAWIVVIIALTVLSVIVRSIFFF
jgi:YggT family protein